MKPLIDKVYFDGATRKWVIPKEYLENHIIDFRNECYETLNGIKNNLDWFGQIENLIIKHFGKPKEVLK